MKRSHEDVMIYLQKALIACGEDGRMSQVKNMIASAISQTSIIGNKRIGRENRLETNAKNELNRREKWLQSLKDGMKKLPENTNEQTGND